METKFSKWIESIVPTDTRFATFSRWHLSIEIKKGVVIFKGTPKRRGCPHDGETIPVCDVEVTFPETVIKLRPLERILLKSMESAAQLEEEQEYIFNSERKEVMKKLRKEALYLLR